MQSQLNLELLRDVQSTTSCWTVPATNSSPFTVWSLFHLTSFIFGVTSFTPTFPCGVWTQCLRQGQWHWWSGTRVRFTATPTPSVLPDSQRQLLVRPLPPPVNVSGKTLTGFGSSSLQSAAGLVQLQSWVHVLFICNLPHRLSLHSLTQHSISRNNITTAPQFRSVCVHA